MTYIRPRPLALVLLFALACGGDSPTGGTAGGNISLETSKAVSDSIGPAGGTLTARAASGVTYTLTIPSGALMTAAKITLTPIAAQQNLPVSGGFAAGVDLAPVGLHFARAAQLTVSPAPTPPAGMVAAAVSFEGDGDSLGLTTLAAGQGNLIAQVTHFSGVSVVFGTTADLQILAGQVGTGIASQSFINQLVALGFPGGIPGSQPIPAALPILQQWFSSVILPELQGARTDAELLLAVGDYDEWAQSAELYLLGTIPIAGGLTPPRTPAALGTEAGQASSAAAASLRQAIAGNNSVCLTQHNFQALMNVLYWQGYATYFGVATPAEQLDVPSLLPGLCARFVAESVGLVDPLPLGQTVSFDQVWAVEIGSSPPLIPADFQVDIGVTGPVTVATPGGFTGPDPQGGAITQGFYTTVVSGQQPGNATFDVQACLISPFAGLGTPQGSGFCGVTGVVRQVGGNANLAGTWVGGVTFGCGNTALASLPLTVEVQGNPQAISGTWVLGSGNCAPGGLHGTFTATMSGNQVLTFTMTSTDACGGPSSSQVTATDGTFDLFGGADNKFLTIRNNVGFNDGSGPQGSFFCAGQWDIGPTGVGFQGPQP